jgi:hypothetical protein
MYAYTYGSVLYILRKCIIHFTKVSHIIYILFREKGYIMYKK